MSLWIPVNGADYPCEKLYTINKDKLYAYLRLYAPVQYAGVEKYIENFFNTNPDVFVEPVVNAKWAIKELDGTTGWSIICSNCGHITNDAMQRYCPKCHARMDGEDNGMV